jgi:hypothetical protein
MGGTGVGNPETIHVHIGSEFVPSRSSWGRDEYGSPLCSSKVKCSLLHASRCGVMKRLRSFDRRAIPPTLAENTATIMFVRSFAKRVALEPILMGADRVAAPLGCIEGPATVMSWEEEWSDNDLFALPGPGRVAICDASLVSPKPRGLLRFHCRPVGCTMKLQGLERWKPGLES